MAIEPHIIEQMKQEWNNAGFGHKTRIVEKFAALAGCSKKTIYGYLEIGKTRKSGRMIENIEDYVKTVFQIKKKPPEHVGEISTDQAIEIAIQSGLIPEWMKNKVATVNRVARDMGFHKRNRRVQRFQVERPNQLHHVDASSSKFFYIKSQLPDGDYLLKIHTGKKGYKNKPVPIRLRPWIYGLTDDHSGVFTGRYVAAYGESILDNIDFLDWAWKQTPDKAFFGVPERIKGDKGPMMRGKYAQDFFSRLGVEIDESTPENKEAHGKIERPWRTAWQRFEKIFFACSDWKKFEITLNELNARFMVFQQEYNSRPHRYEESVSRIDVWKRISLNGGAVVMPDNAISTVISKTERTVGADGCFSIDNHVYEVKGLHDAKVWVFQGIFKDKIVVEDQATGKKYEVEDFRPNNAGEYTSHKETPHQKAVKAAREMEITHSLYMSPRNEGNVVQMPTRVKETAVISDPLDVDSYPSIELAMQDFISISGVVPNRENREAIQGEIIKEGLSRRFVIDLASDVAQRKAMGA